MSNEPSGLLQRAIDRIAALRAAEESITELRPAGLNPLDIDPLARNAGGKFDFLGQTTRKRTEQGGPSTSAVLSLSKGSGRMPGMLPEPVEGQSDSIVSGPSTSSGSMIGEAATEVEATAGKEAEPEKSLEELLAELDALTGLAEVKAEIHRQVAVLRVEGLRVKAGLKSPTITRHLVFVGNPGTGKTTVARLVGGIYRALGLLSKGQLVEVDRSELVAGYLGQTAMKTAEVVASAAGGVLFIDEAYSLAGDQYGTEATDTLVKEMEDRRDDLVLIVAGYPDPMAGFIAQNPGLASRFRTTIEFADYTDEELVDIFCSLAEQADYDVTEDTRRRFEAILLTTPRGPLFGNGRFARNQLEAAIGRHAWRLRDTDEPTVEQLRELRPEDLDDEAPEDEPSTSPDHSPSTGSGHISDNSPSTGSGHTSDNSPSTGSGRTSDNSPSTGSGHISGSSPSTGSGHTSDNSPSTSSGPITATSPGHGAEEQG